MLESRSSMGVLTFTLLLVTVAVIGAGGSEDQLSATSPHNAGRGVPQVVRLNEPVFRLQSTQTWLMKAKGGRTVGRDRPTTQSGDSFSEAFQTHPFADTIEAAFCEWNDKPFGTPHQTLIALRSKPQTVEEPRFHNGVRVFQFGGVYFVR